MEANQFYESTIWIKTNIGIEILKPQDILYCRIEDDQVILKLTSSETVIAKHSLKELEIKLSLYSFYRCHANCLVNLQYIRRYTHKTGEITMIDRTIILVAKDRRPDFYKVIIDDKNY
jgi:two-component system response regulator LytT